MNDPDFFLSSTEGYGLDDPRRCWIKRCISIGSDRHGLLVRLDPPVAVRGFGELTSVLVVPRHQGVSLNPITSWPIYVHVARMLIDDESSAITDAALECVAWAEIYKTEEDARIKRL